MKIIKIFNNNAVATISEDKNDLILTGSGIGFQKRIGDLIDESKIEKRYFYEGGEKNAMYQLFLRTPEKYFKLSQMIMEEAMKRLDISFQDQTIVALTDHICFAVERYETGTELPNLVLTEIKTLYKEEFKIGLWSIDLIEQELNIHLQEDEAGYIALHIINGSNDTNAHSTMETLQLIDGCIQVISDTLNICFDEESLDYVRLTTHLKFMAQRIFNDTHEEESFEDREMAIFLAKKNKKILRCVHAVEDYIFQTFNYHFSEKELLYLMIHIYKIIH
ncbi:PRD domain-containing protein [[Eubacterium] hominis]|uniref:PRD domain-containing protein n=1 Tax=[Eubacterium] hominis TaxID=2764325 RepID=UPI003A4DB2FF